MKKTHFFLSFIFVIAILFSACEQGTDVVDSGTYTGTINEVEPEKDEIYVRTEDGKMLELYFTETTTLSQNGEQAPFSALEKGQQVRVTVEKQGQRLDPISVEIL
jgi:hypothetical protein